MMSDMTPAEIQRLGAFVEILPPLTADGESQFQITVRSMPAPIGITTDKAAARRLLRELSLALQEDDERAVREAKDKIRADGLRRDDYHVNPNRIMCARDGCTTTFYRRSADEHPWDGARANGWVPAIDSDLLCPESAKELGRANAHE